LIAPAYDKLPMYFAPVAGQELERSYQRPVPTANLFEVWEEAIRLGREFWSRIQDDDRISADFRRIAEQATGVLASAASFALAWPPR